MIDSNLSNLLKFPTLRQLTISTNLNSLLFDFNYLSKDYSVISGLNYIKHIMAIHFDLE